MRDIIYYILHRIQKGLRKMTKHTNKILIPFKNPQTLQQFNDYFINKYGTVRGHRAKVIEELIANFNTTQTIQKFEPEYLQNIKDLHEHVVKLQLENTQSSTDYKKLLVENEKNLLQIEELTTKLDNYHSVMEENIRLHEKIKQHESKIDDMNTIQEIQKNRIIELKEELQELKEKHEKTETKLTQKEEKNEALTSVIIKLKDDINNIKQMNVIQRIFKRYPEDKIIELKP